MIIEVLQYQDNWPIEFENEKYAITSKCDEVIDSVEHIGSTSVKGLAAKPIIDILISAKSLLLLDQVSSSFEVLGYEPLGEFGIAGRRYYRKGGDRRTHQIHAFETGDRNIFRHIAFRDYLRAHPDVCIEYQNLKIKLANECDNDIDKYCDGKNDFVQYHEIKALKWVGDT